MRHHFTAKQAHLTKYTHNITLNTYKRCEFLQAQRLRKYIQTPLLYRQIPNWLIHFQELAVMLGTKFLQKG